MGNSAVRLPRHFIFYYRDNVLKYLPIFLSITGWFAIIYNKLTRWWVALVKMVPNFVLAIVILVIFYFLARLLKKVVFKLLHRISGKEAVSGFVATVTNMLIF